MKLVLREPGSEALDIELQGWEEWFSCSIAEPEVIRACRRAVARGWIQDRPNAVIADAESLLAKIGLLDVDEALRRDAGRLEPVSLSTMDALHLAAALSLGNDLDAMFTYDLRLADAARQHKLELLSPA